MMTHEEFIDQYLKNENYHFENGVLIIRDSVDLFNSRIKTLPDNLFITGYLQLMHSDIRELPSNLIVVKGIDLECVDISWLPECLIYGNHLDITITDIDELPPNLKITGPIDNYHSKIKMTEAQQLELIKYEDSINVIQKPTKKVKKLYNLLWRL